jgi:hypothetical protein
MPADTVLGVEVYSCNGEKLGKVKHYFSAAPEHLPDETTEEEFDTPARSGAVPDSEVSAELAMDRVDAVSGSSLPVTGEHLLEPGLEPSGPSFELGASDTKYIEVHHGGRLHIGGESLYVPLDAIQVVEDDGSIVLRCTATEAAARYAHKPPPLQD